MFEYTLAAVSKKRNGKKWGYFLITSICWISLFISSIIGSIFMYDAHLDEQFMLITMLAPPPPPPPPPPPSSLAKRSAPTKTVTAVLNPGTMISVKQAPTKIDLPANEKASFVDPGSYFGGVEGGVEGGVAGGVIGGVIGGVLGGVKGGVLGGVTGGTNPASIPPPPPPRAERPKPPPEQVVRRSEGVIRGNALVRVVPEYPGIARRANVQGEVVIEILIGEDGEILKANVISGHPLLQQGALSTALRWKFKPTLLNNEPVKVSGMLTFRFSL